MGEMTGQMNIFDFIPSPPCKPGDWIAPETGLIGEELTFDEIAQSVGKMIVMDKSTISTPWYKVVLIERIVSGEGGGRRLVYYDGHRQRGLVDETFFDGVYGSIRQRAYRLIGGDV
jgi:hypothetical protein